MEAITRWLDGSSSAVSFAILAGVTGFLAKSFYDLWMARRKDQLERVNSQLKLLYGPLYALNLAGARAWTAFRSKVRPGKAFFGTLPEPTPGELESWRLWMTTVFAPLHTDMVAIISKNGDLLDEDEMPQSLQAFLAHVAAYKVVLARWSNSDFSEHASVLNYPTEALGTYLEQTYQRLKLKQRRLLGH